MVTFYFQDQVSVNLFPLEVFPTFSLVAIGKWLIKFPHLLLFIWTELQWDGIWQVHFIAFRM